jgi:threonine/homoserine/homoserine lactone efflux protein
MQACSPQSDVKALKVMAMGVLIALASFTVLGTYSYIASLSHKLTNGKRQMRINQAAGIAMIIAGIFIIVNKS